jgi:hypothetical protein
VGRTDVDQAVRRLALYRPFADEGQGLHAALRDLLLSAAMVQDGEFTSLAAAQEGIHDLWGIEVEIHELRDVVDALLVERRCDKAASVMTLWPASLTRIPGGSLSAADPRNAKIVASLSGS